MTEIKNRSTSRMVVPGSSEPGRHNWLGVFSDETDPKRYEKITSGTHCKVFIVHEMVELKEPGLLGVVFDSGLRGRTRDALVSMVATGIPVVVGPRAKSTDLLVWEMKPGVDAVGGIFEIATDDSDFKQRLGAVIRAASIRWQKNDAIMQCLHTWISANTGDAWASASAHSFAPFMEAMRSRLEKSTIEPSLAALPGVKAATHDLRHAESGRLDGELIRGCFGLKRTELAKLLGVTPEALRQTPDSPKHQETFALFERIAALRALLADPADFAKWLQSPNAELENLKPGELIRDGRATVVADLVQDILTNRGS